MEKYYVLYNPLSANNNEKKRAYQLEKILKDVKLSFYDITQINDYMDFFKNIVKEDNIIICGGDGTINKFINDNEGIKFTNNIYYFATGTGNDFLNDIKKEQKEQIVLINDYISNLPIVKVNGKSYRFLNGIGYGIDGYCCEEGERQKRKSNKKVNYTSIILKGLLYDYKPTNAEIYIDGMKYNFQNVWAAATMNGRYYGGGMMSAPNQDRTNKERTVSLVIMHCPKKLKALIVFPTIFKGKHVKHTEMVQIIQGKNISVKFDRPTALQIDGETILNVKKYEIKAEDKNDIEENKIKYIQSV